MEKKSRRKLVPSQGAEAETAEILSDKELIQDIRDADEDVRRGKEAGFDFHLVKPIDFHELRSVLDQVSA